MRIAKRISRRGATAVETAIVLPLVILIIFGCLELLNSYVAASRMELAGFRASRTLTLPGFLERDARAAALAELQRSTKQEETARALQMKTSRIGKDCRVELFLPTGLAAYFTPSFLRFPPRTVSASRAVEWEVDLREGLNRLNAQPVPSQRGFNLGKPTGKILAP